MMSGFLRMEAAKAPGAMGGCSNWPTRSSPTVPAIRVCRVAAGHRPAGVRRQQPHSVIFQGWALVRYLNRLLRDLGDERGDKVTEAIVKLVAFPLERLEHHPIAQHQACLELADLLSELEHAANQLSDWLGNRYFTHVGDVSRQTMAV